MLDIPHHEGIQRALELTKSPYPVIQQKAYDLIWHWCCITGLRYEYFI